MMQNPPVQLWTRDGFQGALSVVTRPTYAPDYLSVQGPHAPRRAVLDRLTPDDQDDPAGASDHRGDFQARRQTACVGTAHAHAVRGAQCRGGRDSLHPVRHGQIRNGRGLSLGDGRGLRLHSPLRRVSICTDGRCHAKHHRREPFGPEARAARAKSACSTWRGI